MSEGPTVPFAAFPTRIDSGGTKFGLHGWPSWANRAITGRDQTLLDQRVVVAKLNRIMIGWGNYFCLGTGQQSLWSGGQSRFDPAYPIPSKYRTSMVTVQWSSNIDGPLCSGIMCDSKPLSPGVHTITALVSDPWGATTSAAVTVSTTTPGGPTATILWPLNNAILLSSQTVDLRGTASSPAEGIIPDSRMAWSSSLSGALGTGRSLLKALPIGAQTITLTAQDKFGQVNSAMIQVSVAQGADYPSVQINQPANDYEFAGAGGAITLLGSGTDPVDGTLGDANLQWKSDVDGVLGQGKLLPVNLSFGQCAPIYHHITLTGTNQAGHQAILTITVLSGNIC